MRRSLSAAVLALSSLGVACAATDAPRTTPSPRLFGAPSASASAAASVAFTPPLPPTPPADPAPRIARIEGGLLPRVRVKGEDVRWSIEARMREHRVPGLSVAVFHEDRIVWAKAYGLADADTGERVTTSTLFQAGSISKPVAALAALKAVEGGALKLDAPINDTLTSWKLPDNELTRATPVTLRHLLSHTGGTTVHGFPGYAAGQSVPSLIDVLEGRAPANTAAVRVTLAPGTKFRYSGGGTSIAQLALVERLGKPFAAILEGTVLRPLGMEASSYEQPLPPEREKLAAAGHNFEGKVIEGKRHVYPEMAAAGLWTTPSDLARFLLEMQRGSAGRSTLVSKEIATQMTTSVANVVEGFDVALGLFLSTQRGATFFGHDGADEGFQATTTARLGGGYGAVLMANSDNGLQFFGEVVRAIAAEYGWDGEEPPIEAVAIDPARLAKLAGRYATESHRPFALATKGARLELRRPFAEPIELVPVSEQTFVGLDDGARYEIDGAAVVRTRRGIAEKATRLAEGANHPLFELEAGREGAALAMYTRIQRADAKSPDVDEAALNGLGVRRLLRGDTRSAIALFRVNVALHPDSMNARDSLAEAYARAGDKPKAIAAFEAALAAMTRDKVIDVATKAQLQKNAEKQLRVLRGH